MDISEWIEADVEELRKSVAGVDWASAEGLVQEIGCSERVFVHGLGRSGLVMRMFALRLMQLGVVAFAVGDATTPAVGQGDLVVVGSGSGATQGVLSAAAKARRLGARVAAITADAHSELARMADLVVLVPGATPKSAARHSVSRLPLATVLEQAFLVVTDCVIARLAEELGQTAETMMARHANIE